MTTELSEEEMRMALFGSSTQTEQLPVPKKPDPIAIQNQTSTKPRPTAKPLYPKLRVTMHVTKEFEGVVEVFTYEANTLSTFVAEQEAKNEAKKKKFRYFDVVSIKPI